MPRHPTFHLLGAIAGFALWLVHAPTPFPFLATVAMVCGVLGFMLSTAYVATYEPWRWAMTVASMRRARRRAIRMLLPLADEASAPRASTAPIRALRARP